MTESEKLARSVVDRCIARGIAEFVLCPGSRNSPLIVEVLRRGVRHWSFVDERAAGFFALGRARALQQPVAVCTTSGTAVAELYPAVVEALYQRAPLLCLTADRPASFRGTGAPQAIEQRGLFCLYATDSWDVSDRDDIDLDRWAGEGPAHLNVCLGEPLLSENEAGVDPAEPGPEDSGASEAVDDADFPPAGRTIPRPDLIVLGPLPGRHRNAVAEKLAAWQCPVLADAASGLRERAGLQPLLLRGGEPSRASFRSVLRIGGVPSFRIWRDLEERPDVPVYSVLAQGFSGLARESFVLRDWEGLEVREAETPEERGDALLRTDRAGEKRLGKLLARFPRSEPALVGTLAGQIPAGSSLFLGNSLPIREWNLAAPYADRSFEPWANRGANGIDGNLASCFGLTADAEESWGLFGDLTTLYDFNAPWVLDQLPRGAKRRIVVINNGGGRIFGRLPGMDALPAPTRRVTESAHGLDFSKWAGFWGLDHVRWNGGEWPDLSDRAVIEVVPDPEETEGFWEAWQAKKTKAAATKKKPAPRKKKAG